MTIDSLKDLDKLIQLCQKRGVSTIKVDGLEIHLELQTQKNTQKRQASAGPQYAPGGITEDTRILTEELTPEQLLFYSAVSHDEQQPS